MRAIFFKWISCSCKCIEDLHLSQVLGIENVTIEQSSLKRFSFICGSLGDMCHINISSENWNLLTQVFSGYLIHLATNPYILLPQILNLSNGLGIWRNIYPNLAGKTRMLRNSRTFPEAWSRWLRLGTWGSLEFTQGSSSFAKRSDH